MGKLKKKHSSQIKEEKQIEEAPEGFTFHFHNDKRATVVEVNGKIYNLVETGLTVQDLSRREAFDEIPHVRHLHPIKLRTEAQQAEKNQESKEVHELLQSVPKSRGDKVTSLKKAAALGANVPEAVERLLSEKDKALKDGDTEKAKKIRKQLRALDYKRYMEEA